MSHSVAQIAVSVFILSAPTQFTSGEVTAERIWSKVRDGASSRRGVSGAGRRQGRSVVGLRLGCPGPKGGSELVHRLPTKIKEEFVDVEGNNFVGQTKLRSFLVSVNFHLLDVMRTMLPLVD